MKRAYEAIETAKSLADKDKPDQAYVHYLRASEITVNIIPHHPDYKITVNQTPGWYKQFADLMMVGLTLRKMTTSCVALADWRM